LLKFKKAKNCSGLKITRGAENIVEGALASPESRTPMILAVER